MTAGKKSSSIVAATPGPTAHAFPPLLCSTSGLLKGLADRARANLNDADLSHLRLEVGRL